MDLGKTVFEQLMDFILVHEFPRAVAELYRKSWQNVWEGCAKKHTTPAVVALPAVPVWEAPIADVED